MLDLFWIEEIISNLPKCIFFLQNLFIAMITAQKMKFSINDFSSKCDQIRS